MSAFNAWVSMQTDFQSDRETMSKLGMSSDDIETVIRYIAKHYFNNPLNFDEYDVDRWLRGESFAYFATKEDFAVGHLASMSERIPAGVQVDWDATADYFLTDKAHFEFEDGGVAVWNN